jgi:nicotinamidase-related amidase
MASFRSLVGIPPSSASTGDSVLVIIDAQNEYANGQLRIHEVEESRKVIAAVLAKYREAKAPIIHVVHKTPDGAPVFTPGTDLANEFTELTPKGDESVVTKQFPGSFTGTNLKQLLTDSGRKKVVLTGYMVSNTPSKASVDAKLVL